MSTSRSALLAAAVQEFAVHGVRGTRIQNIVKRAGVNERMIYHHFGSKDGLYAAALEDQIAALHDAWAPVLEKAAALEPYDGMRMALGGFADIITSRPQLVGMWLHEALNGWRTLPLPTADMLPGTLRGLYDRGQRAGVFRPDCPFEIAHGTAMGALFGLVVLAPRGAEVVRENRSAFPSAIMRDQVLDLLLDGMTGAPRG
jgi:AcrR family transcriptional regulator